MKSQYIFKCIQKSARRQLLRLIGKFPDIVTFSSMRKFVAIFHTLIWDKILLVTHFGQTRAKAVINDGSVSTSEHYLIVGALWCRIVLIYWSRVTHIYVVYLTVIGSGNGLSPGRRPAIIWTRAGMMSIEPLGTNFSEILIGIKTFSF